MLPGEILRLLRAQPFLPFRIHVSGGTVYEIRYPEFVMVGLAFVVVGYPEPNAPGFSTPVDIVATRHIIRLEPILEEASQAG